MALSAALVNAATPGARQGQPYTLPGDDELRRVVGAALRTGSRTAVDPSTRAVPAFVELATHARPVFEHAERGDVDRAAGCANELLRRYAPTPALERHDGEPWHLHFHGPASFDASGWGGAVAMGLATVVGSEYAERLGVCAAATCDRVFVDVSRNGTRQFCSVACQNRVKAAAHRARQHS